jgi:Protein of unknown function (DUF3187)
MLGRPLSLRALGVLAGISACATPVWANDGGYIGPLRARDLSPFGFLRLDMRPSHAITGPSGSWAVETELAYQNTWALSPNVEEYLKGLPPGRRELGPSEYADIQNLPGENYLIDLELAELDITVHYKLSSRWSAYAILSGVSYSGGLLDDTIESFHDSFGFSDFGRPAVKRNDTNILFDLKSTQSAAFEAPTQGGLLDPTIGLRYSGFKMPGSWNFVVETAVKVPVQGYRPYLSSGRTDVGVQLSLQRFGASRGIYISASGVYYDGSLDAPRTEPQVIPTLIVGVEQKLTSATHLILQGYASQSIYSRDVTDLDDLLKNKYQASLGVYHKRSASVFLFAITENLQNLNNTPDIGFQLGYTFSPALRSRTAAP